MTNWRTLTGAIWSRLQRWREHGQAPAVAGTPEVTVSAEPAALPRPLPSTPPVDPFQQLLNAAPKPVDVDWFARAAALSSARGSNASITGRWMGMARRSAGLSHAALAAELGHADGTWSAKRCGKGAELGVSIADLKQVESLTGLPLPDRVRRAARPLAEEDEPALRHLPLHVRAIMMYEDAMSRVASATVADEITLLLNAAVDATKTKVPQHEKLVLRRKFGLHMASQSAPAIARDLGVSRYSVETIVQTVLATLAHLSGRVATPALDELAVRVTEANGAHVDLLEKSCQELLGNIEPQDAVRFLRQFRRDYTFSVRRTPVQAGNQPVVVTSIAPASRNLTIVSQAARALTRYSGACNITSLLGYATECGAENVHPADLRDIIGTLPGAIWLDGGHEWLTYVDEPSPLVRRVGTLLDLNERAMDFETLYEGLVCLEKRGQVPSRLAVHAEHLPPAWVVGKVLETHPWFGSPRQGVYSLVVSIEDDVNLNEVEATVAACIRANGGVACRQECAELLTGDKGSWEASNNSVQGVIRNSLYFTRLGRGIYGIRGRHVEPAVIEAAARRAVAKRRAVRAEHRRRAKMGTCERASNSMRPLMTSSGESLT
ncbi:MAG: sigma-70 family RNA polymerase sigma factor [Rhodanobacteraceae bacterium]|nr:MAG: sigma-70 family RNA polymerase sigma factor [Rhodanobacteraceae bacterium]